MVSSLEVFGDDPANLDLEKRITPKMLKDVI